MKQFLLILGMAFMISSPLLAQDDDDGGNEKIRDKMNEYIQKRLDLSKDESSRFTPVFLRYFKEWRQTLRENRGDRLILQQKVIELRLKYRPLFREIIGETRGDQVFNHQEGFIRGLKDIRRERMGNNPGPRVRPLRRND